MQIVIDIPEEDYKNVSRIVDMGLGTNVDEAIKNGIPLPKGHGRLIDESKIPGDNSWDFSDRLMSTPTIIEADKEE